MKKNTYKSILLQTFRDFVDFCVANKLLYYGAYGTVLGAVRHQGLIPWDDDIDVYMPRQDYNRFIALKQKVPTGYEIVDYDNEGYFCNFAKFSNANTTILETPELPFVYGIFIDVFPLDECSESIDKNKEILREYSRSYFKFFKACREYRLSALVVPKNKTTFIFDVKTITNFFYYHRLYKKTLQKMKDIEIKLQAEKGDYYCRYSPVLEECNVFPKKWFGKGVFAKYENLEILIPTEFDLYLKKEYGNYMQLPPIEKRNSGHSHYFVNLNERCTLSTIKKELI